MKSQLWAAAFCLGLALYGGTAAAQESAKTTLQAAKKQAGLAVGKSGESRIAELKKAADMYRVVLEKWPGEKEACGEAHIRIAEILGQCGDTKSAIASADQAIALEGQASLRADALLLKAALLRKEKDLVGAKAALTRLIEECPQDEAAATEALLELASMARRTKLWAEATKYAQDVIDRYPQRWRENVDAADIIVGVLVKQREWVKGQAKLADIDRVLTERFKAHAKWASIEKAMKSMSSRRMLTAADDESD